jgi:hypothetical protein
MKHHRADPSLALVISLGALIFSVSCCEVKAENTTATRAPHAADDPALFEIGDITNLPSFVDKLSKNNDELSQFLWREITKNAYGNPITEKELIDGLNAVLKSDSSIYTDSRFKDVTLSAEASKLKGYNPMGKDLIWLNRLLLQDAYADLKKAGNSARQPPMVWQVRRRADTHDDPKNPLYPCKAQRNDDVWIDVYDVDRWIDEQKINGKAPKDASIRDLVPYLNHVPLTGNHPFHSFRYPDGNVGLACIGFTLAHTRQSRQNWFHLLNQPVLTRQMAVSVGFENGAEMDSYVKADAKDEKPNNQFFLTVIPNRTAYGVVVILGALFAFLALARHTDIVRDTMAPRRPDGLRPYSLARGQMAFWFFLVIASYFFLWIVTGDMDTLNTSVLGLIGISAGTALGSAFIDAARPVSSQSSGNEPTVDVTKPHLDVVAELAKLQSDTAKELESLQKARAQIQSSDKHLLEENERQQNEVRERLANYRWQKAYFAWPTWKGVMYDLLAENNFISFHRFQIFVWTLVLGIMFIANVYNDLAMPQFSATLLGLLGISAGTYVGFKVPEPKAQ